MSERDDELDQLLAPLLKTQASELETSRWKKAIAAARRPRTLFSKYQTLSWATGMAASLVVGFYIGRGTGEAPEENTLPPSSYATVEYVSVK